MTSSHSGFTPSCSRCALQSVCFANGLHSTELNRLDTLVDRKPSYSKGQYLFKAGEEMVSLHAIRSGIIKIYSVLNDQEMIHGFYLPGDIVGMDGMADHHHLFNAKVLDDAYVCSMSLDQLNDLSNEITSLNSQVLTLMSKEIINSRNHASLLTHKSAEEKLADFIISMMEKYRVRGYEYMQFRLAILHRDVANFLNLTPETVSRVLAKFHNEEVVSWKKKEVNIQNVEALFEYANLQLPEVFKQ